MYGGKGPAAGCGNKALGGSHGNNNPQGPLRGVTAKFSAVAARTKIRREFLTV